MCDSVSGPGFQNLAWNKKQGSKKTQNKQLATFLTQCYVKWSTVRSNPKKYAHNPHTNVVLELPRTNQATYLSLETHIIIDSLDFRVGTTKYISHNGYSRRRKNDVIDAQPRSRRLETPIHDVT